MNKIHKENADIILKSIVGSDELVATWWKSQNYYFNLETPESVWEHTPAAVYNYLTMHYDKS